MLAIATLMTFCGKQEERKEENLEIFMVFQDSISVTFPYVDRFFPYVGRSFMEPARRDGTSMIIPRFRYENSIIICENGVTVLDSCHQEKLTIRPVFLDGTLKE